MCDNPPFTDLVPEGRLRVAQDAVLERDSRDGPVPQGRLKITQDAVLGTTWLSFSRPLRDFSWLCV